MRLYTFLLALSLGLFAVSTAHAGTLTITSPVPSGRWGSEPPTSHRKWFRYTNFAVDVYGNQGDPIRWSTYVHSLYDDGFWGQVVEIGNATCDDGSSAGKYVTIRVKNSQNQWVGDMIYSHVSNVQVSLWQTFPWYSLPVLGYLGNWNASCYVVQPPGGIHVHMEWYGSSPYAASTFGYSAYQTINFTMGAISKP